MTEIASEIASFGNVVNSLRAVRNEYNEQLKSIPQYDAFLLVESSTQRVADTLQSAISSAVPSMATEVVAALEEAKSKFRQHLASVPEYRALLAIDKLISDVPADLGVQPVPQSAQAVADEVQVTPVEAAAPQGLLARETVSEAEAVAVEPLHVTAIEQAPPRFDAFAQAETLDEPAAVAAVADPAEPPADHEPALQIEMVIPLPAVPAVVQADEVEHGAEPADVITAEALAEHVPEDGTEATLAAIAQQLSAHHEAASQGHVTEEASAQPHETTPETSLTEPAQATHPETFGHEAEKAA